MNGKARTNDLRERSGRVASNDPIVGFLYELMRDHLPAGKVEQLVRNSLLPKDVNNIVFTNGWLANYACDLRDLLTERPRVMLGMPATEASLPGKSRTTISEATDAQVTAEALAEKAE